MFIVGVALVAVEGFVRSKDPQRSLFLFLFLFLLLLLFLFLFLLEFNAMLLPLAPELLIIVCLFVCWDKFLASFVPVPVSIAVPVSVSVSKPKPKPKPSIFLIHNPPPKRGTPP